MPIRFAQSTHPLPPIKPKHRLYACTKPEHQPLFISTRAYDERPVTICDISSHAHLDMSPSTSKDDDEETKQWLEGWEGTTKKLNENPDVKLFELGVPFTTGEDARITFKRTE